MMPLLFVSCVSQKAEWQGMIEEVNGVMVVYNPEEPLSENAGRVLQLTEEMRITDTQGDFYFKSPDNIKTAPDGSIFVLDEEQFLKFDKKGKFIKNLFKKGQGPGEFERIGNYLFSDNEIVVLQGRPNKTIWAMTSTMDKEKGILADVFNLRGEYIDNFYLPLQHHVKIEGLSQHPMTISGDALFIVEYDEKDIPSVVKYKIKD